jgi:hypothetical protein
MGLDALDLTFRLEKSLGYRLTRSDWEELFRPTATPSRWDCTAGEFHDWVCRRMRAAGHPVPFGSWRRVKICISDVTGTPLAEVRKDAYLIKDLGASF